MKALITGGLGQIGSHVAEELLARGDEVLVIDNLATGRREHLQIHPNLVVVEDTIADQALVTRLFKEFRPDVVLHAAASYKNPDDWFEDTQTNCVGGANVVRAARDFGVARFVYLQTSLCYGLEPEESPISLSHPRNPVGSSYAITKTTAEYFVEHSGLDFVTFRLANVIGPRNLAGPLPIFFKRLTTGQDCFVSESRRDFVFVKDLAKHILMALDGVGSGPYHFSTGQDVSIKELYDAVVNALGFDQVPIPESVPVGQDDVGSILLDPTRTREDFGEFEFTSLDSLVREAVDYYREFGVEQGFTHLRVARD